MAPPPLAGHAGDGVGAAPASTSAASAAGPDVPIENPGRTPLDPEPPHRPHTAGPPQQRQGQQGQQQVEQGQGEQGQQQGQQGQQGQEEKQQPAEAAPAGSANVGKSPLALNTAAGGLPALSLRSSVTTGRPWPQGGPKPGWSADMRLGERLLVGALLEVGRSPPDHLAPLLDAADQWGWDPFALNEATGGRPLSALCFALLKRHHFTHTSLFKSKLGVSEGEEGMEGRQPSSTQLAPTPPAHPSQDSVPAAASARSASCPSPPPQPPIMDDEAKSLALSVGLKVADLGNLAAPEPQNVRWVAALEEEYFRQGDREQELGLPVSALMQRGKAGVSKSQTGFCKVVSFPLFRVFVKAFPDCRPMLDSAVANFDRWRALEEEARRKAQLSTLFSRTLSETTAITRDDSDIAGPAPSPLSGGLHSSGGGSGNLLKSNGRAAATEKDRDGAWLRLSRWSSGQATAFSNSQSERHSSCEQTNVLLRPSTTSPAHSQSGNMDSCGAREGDGRSSARNLRSVLRVPLQAAAASTPGRFEVGPSQFRSLSQSPPCPRVAAERQDTPYQGQGPASPGFQTSGGASPRHAGSKSPSLRPTTSPSPTTSQRLDEPAGSGKGRHSDQRTLIELAALAKGVGKRQEEEEEVEVGEVEDEHIAGEYSAALASGAMCHEGDGEEALQLLQAVAQLRVSQSGWRAPMVPQARGSVPRGPSTTGAATLGIDRKSTSGDA
ncbi:hypothetical protein V8C86DRAFT_1045720 [Haematococcus lacustris]